VFSYVKLYYITIFFIIFFFRSLAEVGAPLFQWIGDHWELVGNESYAIDGCLRVDYKGLFVRVAAYNN
jgi:hypothetical protein